MMSWTHKNRNATFSSFAVNFSARVCSILLIAITSCLEPYNPPEITDDVDILVVDGFINSTDHSATVRLTRARPLSNDSEEDTGVNALVQIEDENGNIQTLDALASGHYTLPQMQVSPDMKYRLSILRENNRRYYSNFIALTTCPQIDSISWKRSSQSAGINIFVNAHDENGQSKYFQWTYDETWEYMSKYGSGFKIVSGVVEPADLSIRRCWNSKPSSEILINSTQHLSSNVIREFPVVFIPVGSQKVSVRYSILVKQRVIDQEAFDFWTQLKKSTESLGGLFDPLPSQVLGNVYNTNDTSEPVLGYFSGGEVTEKRIFIQFAELPEDVRVQPFLPCPVDSLDLRAITFSPDINLIGAYGMTLPEGYTTSSGKNCMDCRDDGGTLTRPDFWN